jgi:hypothetical protein
MTSFLSSRDDCNFATAQPERRAPARRVGHVIAWAGAPSRKVGFALLQRRCVFPADDQPVEDDRREGHHRERPQGVLRAADEAELHD